MRAGRGSFARILIAAVAGLAITAAADLAANTYTTTDPAQARQHHWAYRPLADVPPPATAAAASVRNPIDHFILARLEADDLKPVGAADKRTLIRRATWDLLGLPPTPAEIDAFLADESPDAFARLVDRLLDSPHYGERWGRHWMDLVRYADTAGDNSDYPIPQLYRYRDYVIAAFNADKPYDQFIREQIAGDLLPHQQWSQRQEQVIATGYIALARRFGSVVDKYPQHLTIEDTLDNIGRTFMGLTLSCARCHDHKFDAITQRDYYRLYGMFASTKYAFPGIELLKIQKDFVPLVPQEEMEAAMAPFAAKEKELKAKLESLTTQRGLMEQQLAELKKQREMAAGDEARVAELTEQINKLEPESERLRLAIKAPSKAVEEHERTKPQFPDAYGVTDDKPQDVRMHLRGEPDKLGDKVERGFLTVLGGQTLSDEHADTSGRAQLAQWIADPANPLTARVMVNRIWHYHFGRGIVATPSDFGVRGEAPSHPELLDYLSRQFLESGWSIKAMHRLMMNSAAYQMASTGRAEQLERDPENRLLWKFNRRRLDAEQVRDGLLAISGNLDAAPPNGPHPFPEVNSFNFTQHYPFNAEYETNRRSVYVMTKRIKAIPFFALFDGADPNACTAVRTSSTTAAQALYMLNNEFVHEQSQALATKLLRESAMPGEQVKRLYELALGRLPDDEERSLGEHYLAKAAAELARAGAAQKDQPLLAMGSYVRVILRTNEFLYVD